MEGWKTEIEKILQIITKGDLFFTRIEGGTENLSQYSLMRYNYSDFNQKATLKLNWGTKERGSRFKSCCALHGCDGTKFTRSPQLWM
ncbi:Uncharacterized protein TCM_001119 [Theobroma cacao]|uniref:Uncharacterized protein n=1 Tax=Theobroma cacao TaxID=3641 RepID=A0A061DQA8_THECC|nr:Uncharacterized protein TCM_001119 [Theobroma cacao]